MTRWRCVSCRVRTMPPSASLRLLLSIILLLLAAPDSSFCKKGRGSRFIFTPQFVYKWAYNFFWLGLGVEMHAWPHLSHVSCLATKVQILTLDFKTFQIPTLTISLHIKSWLMEILTHLWSISAEVSPIARPSMSDGCATLLACAVSPGMDRPGSDVWHLNVATYGFIYIISSQRKP